MVFGTKCNKIFLLLIWAEGTDSLELNSKIEMIAYFFVSAVESCFNVRQHFNKHKHIF